MRICSKCNFENADNYKFCIKCGDNLDNQLSRQFCPGCGTELDKDMVFCPSCGLKAVSSQTSGYSSQTSNDRSTYNTGTTDFGTYSYPNVPINDSILLNLQTGTMTAFGSLTVGTLSINDTSVSYNVSFSLSAHSHSYSYSEISSTEFKMTHMGVQPQMGYIVTLKNGTVYRYIYGLGQKNHLIRIDNIINSRIRQ